jgi:hypothetical protein
VQAAGGQLAYRVDFRGRPVLEWSNLGLLLDGAPALGPALGIESAQASSLDETWTSPQGKANPIRNHYNAVTCREAPRDCPDGLEVEAGAGWWQRHSAGSGPLTAKSAGFEGWR